MYEDGIFETMLAANGRITFYNEHLECLEIGSKYLSIPFPDQGTRLK
ncbi:MAG: hypothetical protein OEZ34_12620 [Spirochaetia bacterium]|nr:hypothetical protein [Spirochaetia bacterium]